MNERTHNALDDGQPLVEFAPLKPAEIMSLPRLGSSHEGQRSEWRYVPVRRFS